MSTQIQASVSSALQELGFELQEGDIPGSPSNLKVTTATVEKIQALEGTTVTIDSDGNLSFPSAG